MNNPAKKTENKIASEVAEQEFNRFVDAMDLDVDPDGMDEEDLKGFETQKQRVIEAIKQGILVINDDGEPVFTPQRTQDIESITFYEPTGASLMAMDRRKKNEDMAKMYALMGSITKVHANTFAKMKMSDLKVCQAITILFLA